MNVDCCQIFVSRGSRIFSLIPQADQEVGKPVAHTNHLDIFFSLFCLSKTSDNQTFRILPKQFAQRRKQISGIDQIVGCGSRIRICVFIFWITCAVIPLPKGEKWPRTGQIQA